MAVIVDKTKDKTLTNMHLEMHKKFIHKDEYSEHIQLYGPDFSRVGHSSYFDTGLVGWDEVDWEYEGNYGYQCGRKDKNSAYKELEVSVVDAGIKLNRPPIAIIELPKGITSRGKKYVPVNGRTRRRVFTSKNYNNFIADIYKIDYEFNTLEWLKIYGILSLLFNSQNDDPSGELTLNDLFYGACDAIKTEAIKIPANVDSKNKTKEYEAALEFQSNIRNWIDLALGSGRFIEDTRQTYTIKIFEDYKIANGATPSLMSWTNKKYRLRWKADNNYKDNENEVYLDFPYDNPTYAIRDLATLINQLIKDYRFYEKIPIVNMVTAIPLTKIKSDIKEGYERRRKAAKDKLLERLESYGVAFWNSKPAIMTKVKIYGAYPAFGDMHDMGHFVLYNK